MRSPRWTVFTSVISQESNGFAGQCWEFFFEEDRAEDCRQRWEKAGSASQKRPFNERSDREHMHWVDKGVHRVWAEPFELQELTRALPECVQQFRSVLQGQGEGLRPLLVLEWLTHEGPLPPRVHLYLYLYLRNDGRLGVTEVCEGHREWISIKLPATTGQIGAKIVEKLVPKIKEKYALRV